MKKIVLIIGIFTIIIMFTGISILAFFNKEKINILVYGLDGRNNTDEAERSDAIILINYNYNNSSVIATSIPRDSYVKITCENNKYDKINHAYAYGKEKCLNETVAQLFGIKDIKNVILNFESVVNLIDYFGLIELDPQFTFCQSDEELNNKYCFEKGKKVLIDGKQALAYMRNRKSLPNGDIDRATNQRQILKIVIEKCIKMSLGEKIKYFYHIKKNVKTDINIKDINFKKIINVKQISLKEYTLKGEGYVNKYYYYKLDSVYLEKIKKYYI